MINPLFLYFLITIKLIYLAIIIAIVGMSSVYKNFSDTRILTLSKIKKWVKIVNELVMYSFILYTFNPFSKAPVVIIQSEKVSLFITALIGLSNVNWNLLLNRFGINIPIVDFLHSSY